MSHYSIKNILVAVDLSDTSLNALDTAVALTKKHKASLTIVSVNESFLSLTEENYLGLDSVTSVDVLQALAGAISHKSDIVPKLIKKKGNVAESVIATALDERADLIVMGTHGASGFRSDFIGNNAYAIIKYSNCPVLTVPPKKKFLGFRNVVFPIRPATGALRRYDIVCHFLSVNSTLNVLGLSYLKSETDTTVLDKIAAEIREQIAAGKVHVKTAWATGSFIAEDILRFVAQTNQELIVLTSNLDAIAKPGFLGPHSQKIINCSKVPVLSIKKPGVPMLA